MSRAIDRATRWEFCIEHAGGTVTREYLETELLGTTYRSVRFVAEIGIATLSWIIVLDTPRTRFSNGTSTFRFGTSRHTYSPSQMSRWIFSEIELANYKAEQSA
jgi:hypothetical protein